MVCDPTENDATLSDALPFASKVTVPSDEPPSVKTTLPVGIPVLPVDAATLIASETA